MKREHIRRDPITEQELFDEDGIPQYVEPLGNSIPGPLCLTVEHWFDMCNGEVDALQVYIHHRFTMTSEWVPCRNRKNKAFGGDVRPDGSVQYPLAYDRAISITLPYTNGVIYGPYDRGENLAVIKAAEFLSKHHSLELIDMPAGENVGSWVKQYLKKIDTEWKQREKESRKAWKSREA